jgi:transcriptional regulator with XRE-family HTH domain
MKDRIKLIMEQENLTPSAFADKLQLGRAVVSHILNGRNNPSLEVVTRILSKMNYINPEWLLTGAGDMYKTQGGKTSTIQQVASGSISIPQQKSSQPDLFSQNVISTPVVQPEPEPRKENTVETVKNKQDEIINQPVIYPKAPERKITKIIIYYSDNTFETFNADNKPL